MAKTLGKAVKIRDLEINEDKTKYMLLPNGNKQADKVLSIKSFIDWNTCEFKNTDFLTYLVNQQQKWRVLKLMEEYTEKIEAQVERTNSQKIYRGKKWKAVRR